MRNIRAVETPREPSTSPAWARWALVALTVAAAAWRLPGLTAVEPWFDEVFSVVLASQELPELWRRAVADQTSPPGFYVLLWGWTRLGGFELSWMRLLPALAGTLTVPAMALAARSARLSWAGALVAASLAAVSPLLLAMSSELRAYAPLALLTSLALSLALARRDRTAALAGVGLVLLHYFGAFVVAALATARLLDEPERPWSHRLRDAVRLGLPAALALGAWVLLVLAAAGPEDVGGNAAWIDAFSWRDVPSFASQVVGTFGTTVGAVLVTTVLAWALVSAVAALRARADGIRGAVSIPAPLPVPLAVSLAVLPLLLAASAGAISGKELWVARYLIVSLPGWWLLLARLVDRAPGAWKEMALAAMLTWAGLAGIHAERTRPRKTAWSHVARAIVAGGPRTICTAESFVALPLRYHALRLELPLTVLDLAECTAPRAPAAILLREGTEAALEPVSRAGAVLGAHREMGTRLPATWWIPLSWPR